MRKWLLLLSVAIFASLALMGCGGDDDQKDTYTIGILYASSGVEDMIDGFKTGLAEQNFVEGDNTTYVIGSLEDGVLIDDAAQRIVEAKPDIIFTLGAEETKAVKSLTETIPIIFASTTDPVADGLVASLAAPGGNVTGVRLIVNPGKHLEWLLKVDPTIKTIYVPYDPNTARYVAQFEAIQAAAAEFDLTVTSAEIPDAEAVGEAIAAIPEDTDAIILGVERHVYALTPEWIAASQQSQIALTVGMALLPTPQFLMGYGLELNEIGKQVADFANLILDGISPSELPVQPSDPYLIISLDAAGMLGVEVPDEVLSASNQIVYSETEE